MKINKIDFVGSFVKVGDCPEPKLPEYAFIGRSNVGKSSLINMLTDRKNIARVSNTPGKTQTINHYLVNEKWYLVDLPGYGYAKVSKVQRKKWESFFRDYLSKRENLQCVFQLIDSRIPPQKNDLEFSNWMGEMHIPFVIVFTKIDNKKYNRGANVAAYKEAMLESWEELPNNFLTSSKKRHGKEEVLQFISTVNQEYQPKNEE